jgi:hypothetical protein
MGISPPFESRVSDTPLISHSNRLPDHIFMQKIIACSQVHRNLITLIYRLRKRLRLVVVRGRQDAGLGACSLGLQKCSLSVAAIKYCIPKESGYRQIRPYEIKSEPTDLYTQCAHPTAQNIVPPGAPPPTSSLSRWIHWTVCSRWSSQPLTPATMHPDLGCKTPA